MSTEHLIFVYGSLMQGFQHHDVLEGAVALGPRSTTDSWSLIDLGRFPGVVPGHQSVVGELYRIGEPLLMRLDQLEGCPTFYRRERVTLEQGEQAFIYILQPDAVPARAPTIPSGSWRSWRRSD